MTPISTRYRGIPFGARHATPIPNSTVALSSEADRENSTRSPRRTIPFGVFQGVFFRGNLLGDRRALRVSERMQDRKTNQDFTALPTLENPHPFSARVRHKYSVGVRREVAG